MGGWVSSSRPRLLPRATPSNQLLLQFLEFRGRESSRTPQVREFLQFVGDGAAIRFGLGAWVLEQLREIPPILDLGLFDQDFKLRIPGLDRWDDAVVNE